MALKMKKRFLKKLTADIKKQEEGIAVLEFAIAVPVIVTLLMGTIDLVTYVIAHQRISRAAYTMSNLLTQMDKGLKEAQVSDMMLALNRVSDPYDIATNGKATMTAIIGKGPDGVEPDYFKVAWQRCYGAGTGSSSYGAENTTVAQSSFPVNTIVTSSQILIVTEITYNFEPMLGFLPLAGDIEYKSYFRPRRGTIESIQNDNTTPHSC